MRNFLLFAGDRYYPRGGFEDFEDSFNSLEEAKDYAIKRARGWFHVYDLEKREIVFNTSDDF